MKINSIKILKPVLIIVTSILLLSFIGLKNVLKYAEYVSLKIPEPSGISYCDVIDGFYIVSDNGFLYKTDKNGKVVSKADYVGFDFEDVLFVDNQIFVVEEMTRDILVFNNDLEKIKTYHIEYNGGRNKGFESIAYNPDNQHFYMAVEKEPCYIYEFDKHFNQINKTVFKNAGDISALTFYNNHLYVLSDEDNAVYRINKKTFEVIKTYYFSIINPEGICFNNKGQMYIVSDDMERLFTFDESLMN